MMENVINFEVLSNDGGIENNCFINYFGNNYHENDTCEHLNSSDPIFSCSDNFLKSDYHSIDSLTNKFKRHW